MEIVGLESYNFLLFPKDNEATLGEDGWEICGEDFVDFGDVQKTITSLEKVHYYEPEDTWPGWDKECYLAYDAECIIEFEINGGVADNQVNEIMVRFAVCNPPEVYGKAVELCSLLSKQLELNVLDMRLGETVDFSNDFLRVRSRRSFEEKKHEFFKTLGLPDGAISQPTHCGSAVMKLVRKEDD